MIWVQSSHRVKLSIRKESTGDMSTLTAHKRLPWRKTNHYKWNLINTQHSLKFFNREIFKLCFCCIKNSTGHVNKCMKFIEILYCGNDIQTVNRQQVITLLVTYNLRPRRPPFRLVESEGIGVTSSIRPIFMAERANARRADCAPGPGVFVLFPPVARSLMCRAVIPRDLHFSATSCI